MTIIRRITFSDPTITSQVVDTTNNYLWLSYEINDDAVCIIRKVWGLEPSQVFFEIEKDVSRIVDGVILGTSIFYAYQDSSLIGERLSLTNPLTSTTEISRPGSITENPVDIITDGTFIYYLIPGSDSGTNTKIVKYNSGGTFVETIDLSNSGESVTNAVSFTYDSANTSIWIITSNNPTEKVRVYNSGGWTFTIF